MGSVAMALSGRFGVGSRLVIEEESHGGSGLRSSCRWVLSILTSVRNSSGGFYAIRVS